MPGTVLSLRLKSAPAKAVFLCAVIALALTGAVIAARVGLAAYWAQSLDIETVARAARLDPHNAAIQYRLGELYGWGTVDAQQAVAHLQRATQLSPQRTGYWSGLGWACLTAGDSACSSMAFRKAVDVAPMSAQSYWELSNYLMVTGTEAEVLPVLRNYLELTTRMENTSPEPAFRAYMRAFHSTDALWKILSDAKDLRAMRPSMVTYLVESGRADDAVKYWNELIASHSSIPQDQGIKFVTDLFGARRYNDAAAAWRQLQAAGIVDHSANGNVVFNGGFEDNPLEVPFDWQFVPTAYVQSEIAEDAGHDGKRALHISYAAADNSETQPVMEVIAVDPDEHYRLTAYVRSNEITSDSGPTLRVLDPDCGDCLNKTTPSITGSTPWHPVVLDFTTGPAEHVVFLSVLRQRSRTYPMDITGDFWVDSVSVLPQPKEPAE